MVFEVACLSPSLPSTARGSVKAQLPFYHLSILLNHQERSRSLYFPAWSGPVFEGGKLKEGEKEAEEEGGLFSPRGGKKVARLGDIYL